MSADINPSESVGVENRLSRTRMDSKSAVSIASLVDRWLNVLRGNAGAFKDNRNVHT